MRENLSQGFPLGEDGEFLFPSPECRPANPPEVVLRENGDIVPADRRAFADWVSCECGELPEVVGYWRRDKYGIYHLTNFRRTVSVRAEQKHDAIRLWLKSITLIWTA